MSSPRSPKPPTSTTSRRDFMRQGTAAVVAATVAPYASGSLLHTEGSDILRVGLIGCGGRGTGAAAQALRADPGARLVALADVFEDHLENTHRNLLKQEDIKDRVQVDADHRFAGWDGYKGVVENCDVVLLATSPHFRPLHMKAAVDAGRHLFVEKPVAVDAPGLRSVMESCRKAQEKKLSVVSGLCYRYQFAKQETMKRIHDGAVGDITAMQCTYNTGGLWYRGPRPEWTEMQSQMRNWLYFTWLSGDHIAEQHIHSLDKILWSMKDEAPVKATASGGRIVRTDPRYGNVYDHFNTTFEWKSGVRAFSSCRQWVGASSDVSDYLFGTKGKANIQRHRIEGESKWRWRGDGPDDMYQNEHDELFRSIREQKPINNGDYMCKSTMMALMARMSAYTGQTITWDQALASQEDLTPQAYSWDVAPTVEIARPGLTKFV